MDPRRIACLVSSLPPRGPTSQLLALLRNWPDRNAVPDVLCLDTGPDTVRAKAFEEAGAEVISARTEGGRSPTPKALKRLIDQRGYGVILSSGMRADALSRLARGPQRRVAIKHELAFTPFGNSVARSAVLGLGHLAVLASMDRLVCVSPRVFESLPTSVSRKSVVIRNGVDLGHFRPPTAKERSDARDRLAISLREWVVLFVGSLERVKRPHLLVESVSELRRQGKPARLLVAGEGPLRSQLETIAVPGVLKMIGQSDDVRSLYWASDLFALPSSHEGTPMSVLEALACNLRVMLSDIPAHRDLLPTDCAAGVLFDPTNVAQSVQCLSALQTRPVTAEPRRVAQTHFDAIQMARSYHRLLTTL